MNAEVVKGTQIKITTSILWWLERLTYCDFTGKYKLLPIELDVKGSDDIECADNISNIIIAREYNDIHDVGWALLDAIQNYPIIYKHWIVG